MKKKILIIIIYVYSYKKAYAIAPPDFIINSTQNILQFSGFALAFIFSIFFYLKYHLKKLFKPSSYLSKIFIISLFIVFILTSFLFIHSHLKAKKWKQNVKTEISNVMENINIKNAIWHKYKKISLSDNEEETGSKIFNQEFSISDKKYLQLKKKNKLLVIDLREKLSWKRGSIPQSINIRFADLIDHQWKNLPKNYDYIIFMCWIGTSGHLAVEFLKKMGLKNVLCFKKGVQSVYKNPEIGYNGEFPLKVPKKMNEFLTIRQVSNFLNQGYIPLDIRPYEIFKNNTMPNVVYLFYEAMTSKELEKVFSSLDPDKKYFALCNSELTCWLAKIVGLELESRNIYYAGRYTSNNIKPNSHPDEKKRWSFLKNLKI